MTEVIAKIDRSHYKTIITSGKHEIIVDEPEPFGNDEGPTPYDFILIALGSCIATTLRMYADRKEMSLEAVEVRLTQEKMHAEDCKDCKSKDGFVQRISVAVILKGDLNEEQKVRLYEIAEKCPVHKTLTNEIKIKTKRLD